MLSYGMTDEELLKKWQPVLDFTSKDISELKEEDRLPCAKEMEKAERRKNGAIMVPIIRKKHSGFQPIIENINGKEYLVTDDRLKI
jgi:hypothetical protein